MPKFAVIVQQFVEEVASIIVEAEDEGAATSQVAEILLKGSYDPEWQDGHGTDGNPATIVDIHKALDTDELTDLGES